MLNSSFKQTEQFPRTALLQPAAPDFFQHVAASDLVVSVVSWTHSIISFQRYLSWLCA
jgi:hypothetical protein